MTVPGSLFSINAAVCGWASIQNPFFMLERQFERRFQFSFPPIFLSGGVILFLVMFTKRPFQNIVQNNDLT